MATYYISPSGNDSNAGSIGSPRLTLAGGIGLLSSGDTLNMRAGTYDKAGAFEALFNRGGTSWSNLTTIQAYLSEIVTIDGIGLGVPPSGSSISYVLFKNLIMDGDGFGIGGGGYIGGTIDHIKLEDLEIKNAPGQGIELGGPIGEGGSCWLLRCNIHDNGFNTPGDHFNHGIYTESSNNIVEYCDIHDNNHGYGIHNYNNPSLGGISRPSNNIYRYNRISRNGNDTSSTAGMILATGDNNVAHNNILVDNFNGINVGLGAQDTKLYNNTLYRNGIGNFTRPVIDVNANLRVIIRNNLGVNNAMNFIGGGTAPPHLVEDHNLFTTV